jgi:hypothetical protein
VARIKESGLDRVIYLAKVIKAPNAIIGELFYDISKKKHIDKEREKIPRSLQYPEKLTANAQFRPGNGSIDTLYNFKNLAGHPPPPPRYLSSKKLYRSNIVWDFLDYNS